MSFTIQLTKNEFEIIPQGNTDLMVEKVEVVPPFNPQNIEVTFMDHKGRKLKSNYKLSNETSMFIFSKLVRDLLGDRETISEKELNDLIGKFANVDIKHVDKPSTTKPGVINTFANISRLNGKGNPFMTYNESTGELSEYDDLSDL